MKYPWEKTYLPDGLPLAKCDPALPHRRWTKESRDAEGACPCFSGIMGKAEEPTAPVQAPIVVPLTKEELAKKATSLGIVIDGRWNVARLTEEIAKVEKVE